MLATMFDNKTARWLSDQGYYPRPKLVVSLSGGKDSTAMVHRLLEWGYPIDALVFMDTGWEFPAMYNHLALMQRKTGLKINFVHPRKPFSELIKRYRWPGPGLYRWCTREKISAVNKWINQNFKTRKKKGRIRDYIIHVIGFALDEPDRWCSAEQQKKINVFYPLLNDFCWAVDPAAIQIAIKCMGDDRPAMTEKDALQYCFDLGYHWGGLYELMGRVSCYCCPLKRKKDIHLIHKHFPDLWQKMLAMEKTIPEPEDKNRYIGFRGKETLHDIDDRLSNVSKNISTVHDFEQGDLFGIAA